MWWKGAEQMNIGLIDVDSHNFPNLPLMKISAYHKGLGDNVEFYNHEKHYGKVYASKVFTESMEKYKDINAHEVIKGGSGYDLKNKLPYEIEHQYPDYDLYNCDFAIGWLTRGCPRVNHSFCITPKKDGCKAVKVADLKEFWKGQKVVSLLDQNLLACKDKYELLKQMADSKVSFLFDGGLDVRFMTKELTKALKQVKVKEYHFAWDDPKEDLESKFKLFRDEKVANTGQVGVYVLVNYWSTIEEDLHRIYVLRSMGYMPYVMIYDKQKYVDSRGKWLKGIDVDEETLRHFKTCQHMQRWANNRALIKSVPDFEDYQNYKDWKRKGMQVPTRQRNIFEYM